MGLNQSLYIGLSGMNANTSALNVISDNIANMNTVGFKAGRSQFQEMLGNSFMGTAGMTTIGGGVGVATVDKMFSQGTMLGTGGEFDMAIGGDGFFALQGDVDGVNGMFYTRNGQFTNDKDGFITNANGLKLMGYEADSTGNIGAQLTALKIDDSPIPPTATKTLGMAVNLQVEESKIKTFDSANPSGTSDYMSTCTVYDGQGKAHEVAVYYNKQPGSNTWNTNMSVDGESPTSGPTLTFDDNYQIVTPAQGTIDVPQASGTGIQVTVDFANTTTYAEKASQPTKITQDGSQSGTFQNIAIAKDGKITGTFSNGEERVLGQVGLARFTSNGGLRSTGGGLYASTLKSGNVLMGTANSNGRGEIVAGALEQSTVDIATEFTNMIVAQRGYQANSRTITTADQIMQEAVNLKR
jgi:flagellar hook protein FlgE